MARFKIEINSRDKIPFVVQLLEEYGLHEKHPGYFTDQPQQSLQKTVNSAIRPHQTSEPKTQ